MLLVATTWVAGMFKVVARPTGTCRYLPQMNERACTWTLKNIVLALYNSIAGKIGVTSTKASKQTNLASPCRATLSLDGPTPWPASPEPSAEACARPPQTPSAGK